MKKEKKLIIIVIFLSLAIAGVTTYAIVTGKKFKKIIGGYKIGDKMSEIYSYVHYGGIKYTHTKNGWLEDIDDNSFSPPRLLSYPQIKIEKFTFKLDPNTNDYILIA